MPSRNAAKRLETEFGSQMFIGKDGLITFSIPAKALKRTILGHPETYHLASVLMQLAETEHSLNRREGLFEAELRKADLLDGRS